MSRRLHVEKVKVGWVYLPADEAHHARKVLRLAEGDEVEVFDDVGRTASGTLALEGQRGAAVRVEKFEEPPPRRGPVLTVASAVPKGDRADWMIEKLSEAGVDAFVPLAAARSVVVPDGKAKLARWTRLATESAKQSRRNGVMHIHPVRAVLELLRETTDRKWVLATEPQAKPIRRVLMEQVPALTIFVGPEGGWTEEELAIFAFAKASAVRMIDTILRVETAAVAGAILARTMLD